MATAEIWIIPCERKVLVTEFPGPPMSICGYVSDEARKAAQARGWPTVSDIGFPKELYLGKFETPEYGWGKAKNVAEAKAAELGYEVEYHADIPPTDDDLSEEDEELFDDDKESELDDKDDEEDDDDE